MHKSSKPYSAHRKPQFAFYSCSYVCVEAGADSNDIVVECGFCEFSRARVLSCCERTWTWLMCVISSVLASSIAPLFFRLSDMASPPPEHAAEEEMPDFDDEEEEDLQLPQAEDDGDVFGENEEKEEKNVTGTEGEIEEAASAAMVAMSMMCLICGLHARKTAQLFCSMGCEGLVRAASRDAKAQGPERFKAWQAHRKMWKSVQR